MELTHEYPDLEVHLDVWTVLEYTGEPRPREDQVIDWVQPEALANIALLPADLPIVAALR